MARYNWTLGGALGIGFVYFVAMAIYLGYLHFEDAGASPPAPYDGSKFLWWPSWLVAAVVALATTVSIWGFIGVMIASARAKIETLAKEDAVISRKSWHYRLQKWLGDNPDNIRGECEYWPKLAQNLFFVSPFVGAFKGIVIPALYCVFIAVILPIVLIVGWLFGARPKSVPCIIEDSNQLPFHRGHQWAGPTVAVFMFIWGIISIIRFTGWSQVVWKGASGAPWVPIGVGMMWAMIGLTILFVVLLFGVVVVLPLARSIRPLVSYVLVRFVIRRCRKIRYTD